MCTVEDSDHDLYDCGILGHANQLAEVLCSIAHALLVMCMLNFVPNCSCSAT